MGSQLDWIFSIKDKLDQANQDNLNSKQQKACIYRAPFSLKDRNHDSYVPRLVSLGPYHSSNPKLRLAERQKWRALDFILKRNNHKIYHYLDAVRELEDRARSCYEGEITLTSDEFVEMMVIDGCFLIEIILALNFGFEFLGYPSHDPFFSDGALVDIVSDMMLLENQIPISVLDRLAAMQNDAIVSKRFIARTVIEVFKRKISPISRIPPYDPTSVIKGEDGFNILDIIRRSQVFDEPVFAAKVNMEPGNVPCACKLKEAGVRFATRKGDPFWVIEFSERTLKMPELIIQDNTKRLLHNMIGYEQRHPRCANVVIPYTIFMGHIINSPEDAEYLNRVGIIQNRLGSYQEVVELFYELNKDVKFSVGRSYICGIVNQINRHYNTRWNMWRANLKLNYFGNPWSIISFLAALFLLVLTFTQTFFSVLQYFEQKN